MHFPVHLAMRIYSLDLSDLSDGRYPTKMNRDASDVLTEGKARLQVGTVRRAASEALPFLFLLIFTFTG